MRLIFPSLKKSHTDNAHISAHDEADDKSYPKHAETPPFVVYLPSMNVFSDFYSHYMHLPEKLLLRIRKDFLKKRRLSERDCGVFFFEKKIFDCKTERFSDIIEKSFLIGIKSL